MSQKYANTSSSNSTITYLSTTSKENGSVELKVLIRINTEDIEIIGSVAAATTTSRGETVLQKGSVVGTSKTNGMEDLHKV